MMLRMMMMLRKDSHCLFPLQTMQMKTKMRRQKLLLLLHRQHDPLAAARTAWCPWQRQDLFGGPSLKLDGDN